MTDRIYETGPLTSPDNSNPGRQSETLSNAQGHLDVDEHCVTATMNLTNHCIHPPLPNPIPGLMARLKTSPRLQRLPVINWRLGVRIGYRPTPH